MNITEEFTVERSVDAVWIFFQDIPTVAACIPGAELVEDLGNGEYVGTMEAKLGPMKAKFEGTASVVMDSASRTAHIEGEGADRRGGSRGRVEVECRVGGGEESTVVMIEAQVALSGAAAQFGRTSLVQELSGRIIAEFADCLEKRLAGDPSTGAGEVSTPEIRVGSLVLRSLVARVVSVFRRWFGRDSSGS